VVGNVLRLGDPKTVTAATPVQRLEPNPGQIFYETTLTIDGTWGDVTGNPGPNSDYFVLQPNPTSWFQIFAGGTTQKVANIQSNGVTSEFRFIPPNTSLGSLPGGPISRFTTPLSGLREALGAKDFAQWFYNSYQTYRTREAIVSIVDQYSHYNNVPDWEHRWPGEQFEVPLLFSEVGRSRLTNDDGDPAQLNAGTQQRVVVEDVVTFLENIWNQSTKAKPTNFMGYGVFEYADEPNQNDSIIYASKADAWFGLYTYYQTNSDPTTFPKFGNEFRQVHVLPGSGYIASGTTKTPFETIFAFIYDVYQLFPVTVNGVTTADKIKSLFKAGKVNEVMGS
jgi:hypothetical protein